MRNLLLDQCQEDWIMICQKPPLKRVTSYSTSAMKSSNVTQMIGVLSDSGQQRRRIAASHE
jgi:hypothetical protein